MASFDDDDDGCGGMDGVAVVVMDVVLLLLVTLVAEDEDEDDRLGLERLPPKERRFRRRGVVLDVPNDGRDDFVDGAVSPTKKSALI